MSSPADLAVPAPPVSALPTTKESLELVCKVEPLAFEVGPGLVQLVEGRHNPPLRPRHARQLLSRQDTKNILGRVVDENPTVIEDLVSKLLSLATVRKVMQNPRGVAA